MVGNNYGFTDHHERGYNNIITEVESPYGYYLRRRPYFISSPRAVTFVNESPAHCKKGGVESKFLKKFFLEKIRKILGDEKGGNNGRRGRL